VTVESESECQCSDCEDVRPRSMVEAVPRTPQSQREKAFGTPKTRYYCKDKDCFPEEEDYEG